MSRLALAGIAIKALLASLLAAIAVGFFFAGIDKANQWLIGDGSGMDVSWLLCAARFWAAYWWLIFFVIFYPLWLGLLILFIRRMAPAGYRLAVAGMIGVIQGVMLMMDVIGSYPPKGGRDEFLLFGVYLSLAMLLLVGGAWLASRRPRPA